MRIEPELRRAERAEDAKDQNLIERLDTMNRKMAEHDLPRWVDEAPLARAPRPGSPAQAQRVVLGTPGNAAFPPDTPGESRLLPEKPRILIVASEPVARLLDQVLAQHYRIQTLPTAALALEVTRHPDSRPDLILLDSMGQARANLEMCRVLKSDETTQSIPVMVITERKNSDEEARALALGAEDCISRPFHLDVVESRVRNQIRIKNRTDLLERYANQDSLTDLANRRCFDLALDAEWRRAMRDRQPLSLVMVDVDCFKQFNDLYGHREGDHCLRRVARAMAQALTRPGDLLARYGGEEFAAILPGTDLEGARCMGERLRDAVAELQIPQQRPDHARKVTISAGCASAYPTPRLTCHTLLQAADEKLYLAKSTGRNCVR
jgi:diguanylate cyclase (GGDEF)-like protein